MSFSVLTRAYGNDRSGTNGQESVLTAAAVRSRGIKRLFSLPLPGRSRRRRGATLDRARRRVAGWPHPRSGLARDDGEPGLRVRRQ